MNDMEDASYVIDINIFKEKHKRILDLSQETYINKVLERFQKKNCSPSITPIVKGNKFNLNQCIKNDFERKQMKNILYALVVGSIMFVQVCTKPNMAFVVYLAQNVYTNMNFLCAQVHVS